MTGEHYEPWELFEYLDAIEEQPSASRADRQVALVAQHVKACARCAELLTEIESFVALLKDEDVYEPPRPLEHDIRAAQAFARRTTSEDEQGARVLSNLRRFPVEEWRSVLAGQEAHAGVVRALIAEARAFYEQRPESALAILSAAEPVANRLDDIFDLAACRGALAKERANVLRFLARYGEALTELENARKFVVNLPVYEFDMALIEWSQATVLFAMTRYAEALQSVRAAMRTLGVFGDEHRLQQAAVLEASILHEQGMLDDALARYRNLIDYFTRSDDSLTQARILSNIADCELRLGRLNESALHASSARILWLELGNATERVRVDWMLASIDIRLGNLTSAEAALRTVRNIFIQLGMRSEAGEVLLDIVEICVLQERWSEAAENAACAAEVFIKIEAPVHIASAFEYLRSNIEERRATVSHVQIVRDHVADVSREAAFIPPNDSPMN